MKNNYKDYAWNEFEKSSYLNGEIKIPSKYKIKINDDLEKRIELELILEKLPQYYLSYWAITNAKRYIDDININNENLKNSIIEETLKALENRIEGKINAYNLLLLVESFLQVLSVYFFHLLRYYSCLYI